MKKDSNLEENASAFEIGGIRVLVLESSSNACKYFLKKDKGFDFVIFQPIKGKS